MLSGVLMRHTAMKRNKLSLPMEYLDRSGLIYGRSLDYGAGYGYDADVLGMDRFDPETFPSQVCGKYDTITCIYVLNTLGEAVERRKVLESIQALLNDNGVAYIAVRRDKRELTGKTQWYITSLGMYCLVNNAKFALYLLKKTTTDLAASAHAWDNAIREFKLVNVG